MMESRPWGAAKESQRRRAQHTHARSNIVALLCELGTTGA
jgi:hypothetical protein